jgi:hypothetical protein
MTFTALPLQHVNGSTVLMFFCRSLWRRWLVAKFAMPDFATGICNVPAGSQRRCGEKNYGDDQWC